MKISWNTYTKTEMKLTQIVYISDRKIRIFCRFLHFWNSYKLTMLSKMFLSGQSIENKKTFEYLYA